MEALWYMLWHGYTTEHTIAVIVLRLKRAKASPRISDLDLPNLYSKPKLGLKPNVPFQASFKNSIEICLNYIFLLPGFALKCYHSGYQGSYHMKVIDCDVPLVPNNFPAPIYQHSYQDHQNIKYSNACFLINNSSKET